MLDRVKVARQIQINYCRHAPQHTAPDFRQGVVWRPLRSKSIGVGAEIRLEDSFQDQLHRALHHAVADARNLKRSDFAISLRDLPPAVRHGFVPVCDEVFPHRRKKRRPPRRLDVREFLAIDSSGAAVALRYTVGLFEGLDLRDVYEEPPEAMRLVRLRLSIWALLSFHPCLTLVSGALTGPGPSLRARFAARPSPVLRPDPSPWRLCPHFPLAVIAGISSARFLRRAPRASPVSTSSFTPCRR